MNFEEYANELYKNIPKILDEDIYIAILNKGNNLARFDIINKIYITTVYGTDIYDVKTKEEWFSQGRKIIDTSKYINVSVPDYSSEYIDTETHKVVNISDFTVDEFRKAIEYGIIKKESKLENVIVQRVYDIKNTSNIDKDKKYSVPKPYISMNILFGILKKFMNITIEQSDDFTYFAKKEKHLYLSKSSYEDTVDELISILVDYFMETEVLSDIIEKSGLDQIDLNSKDMDLLKESIKYSLMTVFNVNNKDELLSILKRKEITDCNKLINILTISDYTVFNIIELLDYSDNSKVVDATSNILLIKKSEQLLSIMQANSVQSKMKGV